MKIEAKFKIGNTVWVMRNDKPYSFSVYRMEIEVAEIFTAISILDQRRVASGMDSEIIDRYDEKDCFATKKELLDSFLTEED